MNMHFYSLWKNFLPIWAIFTLVLLNACLPTKWSTVTDIDSDKDPWSQEFFEEYIGNTRVQYRENTLKIFNQKIDDFEAFSRFFHVDTLVVESCHVSKFDGLKKFRGLKRIFIHSSGFTNADLNFIHGNQTKELSLFANSITGSIDVSRFSSLEKLDLSLNRFDHINGLEKLKNIRSLNLMGSDIKDLPGIEGLPFLNYLNIIATNIPEEFKITKKSFIVER